MRQPGAVWPHLLRSLALLTACLLTGTLPAADQQPAPQSPVQITVFPDRLKQVVTGLGFEIQSDSIGSGNHGLPEEPVAIPHDLVPAERERLAHEMLRGFRWCRLAGGLYWRGLDAQGRQLRPRWPEQLAELKTLLDAARVAGLCFEYWSPAPFWKSNRSFIGGTLRCFGKDFAKDPEYQGDRARFLDDFAKAVAADIATLRDAGLPVAMFGLQNEPHMGNALYPTCRYHTPEQYIPAFTAVATAVRALDPGIRIIADTSHGFPSLIAPGMQDPAVAALVDAYAVHIVGEHSNEIPMRHTRIRDQLPHRPWFQNEYEYLTGGASPDRCLNTVQHIMNCFQLAENPTWFWLHALKPLGNAEASGYALGFWRSRLQPQVADSTQRRRWIGGPAFTALPAELEGMEMVSAKRPDPTKPGLAYVVFTNRPVTAYLVGVAVPEGWTATGLTAAWEGGTDLVATRAFPAGTVKVPATTEVGCPPYVLFLKPDRAEGFQVQIGVNLPIQVRSQALALEAQAAAVQPGHWIFNAWNWHAVGSFVRRMPWDSTVVDIAESGFDGQARCLAFRRPDGRLTVVLSNRRQKPWTFRIATGLTGADWRSYRYTPDEAGPDTLGIPVAEGSGPDITATLPGRSWEFWEQQ